MKSTVNVKGIVHLQVLVTWLTNIFFKVIVKVAVYYPRWWSRRTCAHLLWELPNYYSLLNNHQQNVGSHQKKIPHIQGQKEKPQQDGRRGEITSRIKYHTHQRHSEGSNKVLCAPGDPTETEPDLPLSVWVSPVAEWVSSGLPQGQELWVQHTWVWNKPSWRRLPLTAP